MEIVKAPAKIVYCGPPMGGTSEGAARSRGVDPEQEVIGLINFTLEDLTAKKGYFVTPMDEFFRRTTKRLNLSSFESHAVLPRSTNPPITFIWAGGSLKLSASRNDNKNTIEYKRIISEDVREHYFDDLDTGKLDIEGLLARIKGRPLGETIEIKLEGLEMCLQAGYDAWWGSGHYVSTKTDVEMPRWVKQNCVEEKVMRTNAEEVVTAAEEILDAYLAQLTDQQA